jgi:carboxylate-amine ligase
VPHTGWVRTVGVEEELLLVDPTSGCPIAVAGLVLDHVDREAVAGNGLDAGQVGPFGAELQQQQLEIRTRPHVELEGLAADIRTGRDLIIDAASAYGARALAVGTSPLPVEPELVRKPRYEEMAVRFGLTAREYLTCGCHVHVSVDSDAEAVGVLDRIRVWLPAVLAISGNSPFWQGADTDYESYRSQAVRRWPSSGPTDVFGSVASYRNLVSSMVSCGVLIDEGMVYFDARVSRSYPTVEIRIADVCLDARDAVLVAALCRGLVETAAREWSAHEPAPVVSTALLRLATWQAGRYGLDGNLLDPFTAQPRPAQDVLRQLLDHIGHALGLTGDETLAEEGVERVIARGNGAGQQRAALQRAGHLVDVMDALAAVTAGRAVVGRGPCRGATRRRATTPIPLVGPSPDRSSRRD